MKGFLRIWFFSLIALIAVPAQCKVPLDEVQKVQKQSSSQPVKSKKAKKKSSSRKKFGKKKKGKAKGKLRKKRASKKLGRKSAKAKRAAQKKKAALKKKKAALKKKKAALKKKKAALKKKKAALKKKKAALKKKKSKKSTQPENTFNEQRIVNFKQAHATMMENLEGNAKMLAQSLKISIEEARVMIQELNFMLDFCRFSLENSTHPRNEGHRFRQTFMLLRDSILNIKDVSSMASVLQEKIRVNSNLYPKLALYGNVIGYKYGPKPIKGLPGLYNKAVQDMLKS